MRLPVSSWANIGEPSGGGGEEGWRRRDVGWASEIYVALLGICSEGGRRRRGKESPAWRRDGRTLTGERWAREAEEGSDIPA